MSCLVPNRTTTSEPGLSLRGRSADKRRVLPKLCSLFCICWAAEAQPWTPEPPGSGSGAAVWEEGAGGTRLCYGGVYPELPERKQEREGRGTWIGAAEEPRTRTGERKEPGTGTGEPEEPRTRSRGPVDQRTRGPGSEDLRSQGPGP